MARGLETCYQCRGVVPPGFTMCPGCGANLSDAARAEWLRLQRERSRAESWRLLFVLGVIAALVLGAAFVFTREDSSRGAAATAAAAGRLDVADANDGFMRLMNRQYQRQRLPLQLVSWVKDTAGGVIFEMERPTPEQPLVLWQALDATGRQNVMVALSVNYTKYLLVAETWPEGTRGAFPPMTLRYKGETAPLATRGADGHIQVYASALDPVYAPLLQRVQAAEAAARQGGPASGAAPGGAPAPVRPQP